VRFDIPDSELQWSFDTSGGPGGQHANRSNTRVELTFDIEQSRAFDEQTRSRLVARLGRRVRVTEGGSRSQATNRKRARRSLTALLEDAARPDPPPRRRTRPSLAARRRRLARKRERSELKRQRDRPARDD
jgi:ribosome-associated protein